MTPAALQAHSRGVLARHARTFRLASRLLPAEVADEAAIVYAFCREADDLADETGDAAALQRLRAELDAPRRPLVAAFTAVLDERGVPRRVADDLLVGIASDLERVRIRSDAELIRYAYRVAGTVGLMMAGVLGAGDQRALPHALDLGIAMQITNICRDVAEDARRGRVYLPADRLRRAGVEPDDLVAGRADPDAVGRVVRDLLELADRYYLSGEAGLRFIPLRSRTAIAAASRMYRGIGAVIRRRGFDVFAGRAVTSPLDKARELGVALARLGAGWAARARSHDAHLHRDLAGFFGADAPPPDACWA